ncbi:MAG: transposase [Candidatus Latescibacteria bacterium]|nr:transposase [Candidatus Latescibacterota bacterium]
MARHDLTDEEFEGLTPLLPVERPNEPGCPYRSHHQGLTGLFWILGTGAPWRDLPSRYGPWTTGYDRFRRWRQQGLWQQFLDALEAQARRLDRIDFTFGALDGRRVRAHQAAAGAKKKWKAPCSVVKQISSAKPWDTAGAATRPNSMSSVKGRAPRAR